MLACSCLCMQLCLHVVCRRCFVTSFGARVFFLIGIAILVIFLNYHESSVCRDLGMERRSKKQSQAGSAWFSIGFGFNLLTIPRSRHMLD